MNKRTKRRKLRWNSSGLRVQSKPAQVNSRPGWGWTAGRGTPRSLAWSVGLWNTSRKHVSDSVTQPAPPLKRKPRPPRLGRFGSPAVGVIVQPEPLDERVSCSSEWGGEREEARLSWVSSLKWRDDNDDDIITWLQTQSQTSPDDSRGMKLNKMKWREIKSMTGWWLFSAVFLTTVTSYW